MYANRYISSLAHAAGLHQTLQVKLITTGNDAPKGLRQFLQLEVCALSSFIVHSHVYALLVSYNSNAVTA
jgi:hypothetical protein